METAICQLTKLPTAWLYIKNYLKKEKRWQICKLVAFKIILSIYLFKNVFSITFPWILGSRWTCRVMFASFKSTSSACFKEQSTCVLWILPSIEKTSLSNALVYLYASMYKKLLVNNLPICGSNHLCKIISFFC